MKSRNFEFKRINDIDTEWSVFMNGAKLGTFNINGYFVFTDKLGINMSFQLIEEMTDTAAKLQERELKIPA